MFILLDLFFDEVHAGGYFLNFDRGKSRKKQIVFLSILDFIFHVDRMIYVGSSLLQVYVVDVFLAVAVGFPFGS